MKQDHEIAQQLNRREFLKGSVLGLGAAALGSLLNTGQLGAAGRGTMGGADDPAGLLPHFVPRAKRVIYLFQSGAPSQLELFDYKPKLREMFGQELPDSVRGTQRLTGMSSGSGLSHWPSENFSLPSTARAAPGSAT
jgi:hypothetical protein